MSVAADTQFLLQPISAERPCGESLEDTHVLASFDGFRLFGRLRSPEDPADPDDKFPPKPLDWGEVRAASVEALTRSKDLRVLAHLAAALLRTDGLPAFLGTIEMAAHWVEAFWPDVYPALDEGDPIFRRSALNCFADPMAVIDRLRRMPLVTSRQAGSVSLREVEVADGKLPPAAGERPLDAGQIAAVFAATPPEDLVALRERVSGGVAALKAIDARLRAEGGTEAAPEFEPLIAQLGRIRQVLSRYTAAPEPEEDSGGQVATAAEATMVVSGAIRSRQDAMRALDAVAEFFRQTEPSSPVPLLLARAKRLVAKDFLEILADLAPEALDRAREAAGVKSTTE